MQLVGDASFFKQTDYGFTGGFVTVGAADHKGLPASDFFNGLRHRLYRIVSNPEKLHARGMVPAAGAVKPFLAEELVGTKFRKINHDNSPYIC